jgi:RNA polymerase sigma-70 factor (ECF subfamily)
LSSKYLQYVTEMDPLTLDQLMKEYGQDVWNFAYFICKNRDMTDDITQDVFLQAYRHVSSFRGEASVKTWLLKITRNISYNYRHSAFFRRVILMDTVKPTEQQLSAEEAFMEQEISNDVWKTVLQLSPKLREVIVLDAKYELSTREISRILGISEGTVKSRLFRARKKMFHMLNEEELANENI